MIVALPIGIASAVYLHEYARPGRLLRTVRLGISNLAGVPSVIFGLFGMAFFVIWLKFGVSILAGALTLGALSLPVIIGASEEALRAVPQTLPRGLVSPWRHQVADHLPGRFAGGLTRHTDRCHLGHQSSSRRDGTDHVYCCRILFPQFADIPSFLRSWPCRIISMYLPRLEPRSKRRDIYSMELPWSSSSLFWA